MDTDRIRYFCTIAEMGSLTKAAEILGISHSGLSKAMSVLQSELGVELLRPLGRGLELTEVGLALYPKCKSVIDSVQALKGKATEVPARALRIGMTEIFSLTLAGEFVSGIAGNLDLHECDTGELEVQVLEGHLDFAVSLIPFPHADLEYLKIKKVAMGVYFANRNFEHRPTAELPFVIPNTELKHNPLSIKTKDGWPSQLPRKVAYGASTLALALRIVDSGAAAVLMPKFVAGSLNSRREAKCRLREHHSHAKELMSLSREVFLLKKRNAEESRAMKICAKIIRLNCN